MKRRKLDQNPQAEKIAPAAKLSKASANSCGSIVQPRVNNLGLDVLMISFSPG
jgi:hypothetical protein